MVVLKPLSAALADGDLVYCVIRGSAVNNDGGGDGLTAPTGPPRKSSCGWPTGARGVRRADVQYVELHGTGTPLGDRVEAGALGAVLGAGRLRPAAPPRPWPWARPRPTWATWRAPPGSWGCSRRRCASSTGSCRRASTSSAPPPASRWRSCACGSSGSWAPGRREAGRQRPRLAGVSSFGRGGHQLPRGGGRAAHRGRVPASSGPQAADERAGPLGEGCAGVGGLGYGGRGAVVRKRPGLPRTWRSIPSSTRARWAARSRSAARCSSRRAVVLGGDREELLRGLGALARGSRRSTWWRAPRWRADTRGSRRGGGRCGVRLPRPGLPVGGDGAGAARSLASVRRADAGVRRGALRVRGVVARGCAARRVRRARGSSGSTWFNRCCSQ